MRGFEIFEGFLNQSEQQAMIEELREAVRIAPLVAYTTPYGKRMSVRMTSAGKYGWVSDRRGYRYERNHPSGCPWPPIPATVQRVWDLLTGRARKPECCLVNFYGEGTKMGMHRDSDEADFSCRFDFAGGQRPVSDRQSCARRENRVHLASIRRRGCYGR